MEEQGTLPVLYVSSWLLTSFGSDFPLFFSSRVLDVVLTGSYPHAMIKVSTNQTDTQTEVSRFQPVNKTAQTCQGAIPDLIVSSQTCIYPSNQQHSWERIDKKFELCDFAAVQ